MKLLDPDAGIDQYHQSVLIASKSLEAKLAAWELQSDQPGGGMMLRKEIERSARTDLAAFCAEFRTTGRIGQGREEDTPRGADC
jgi:hypothetical protein